LKPEDNENKQWQLKAYSDADFAGDRDTYQHYGICSLFYECTSLLALTWTESVTLSTNEAEYMACIEVVKEILCILHLLRHLQVKVQLPIGVHVDNIGAIFLGDQNSSDRTKHVDTRYHFV